MEKIIWRKIFNEANMMPQQSNIFGLHQKYIV